MTNPIRRIRATLIIATLVALPAFVAADDGSLSVPTVVGTGAKTARLDVVDGRVPLTLDEAVATSLEHNLGLVVQRHAQTRVLLQLAATFGIYDLNLNGSGTASESTSPVVSSLVATGGAALTSEQTQFNVSLSRLFPVGGTATVSFQSTRNENNNAADDFNPSFTQGLRFNFTQPLLRNFGRTATERDILVQRYSAAIGQEDFDTQVEQLVQDIADAFWQLVEAREQLSVAEESLSLAEELHKNNKIQVEVGTLAPLETVRSEAGVADRRVDIITRKATVEDLQDSLRRLLNLERGDLWRIPIEPEVAEEANYPAVDLDLAIDAALAHRNDIRRKELEIKQSEIDAKIARNQLKPELNLVTSYGFNGLGGDSLNRATGIRTSGGFSDALNQVFERSFDQWSVQLNFAYPLRNRAAKARRAGADLAVKQGHAELAELEQNAITTVRQLARNVESAAQQIDAARISTKLEEKNLEAERKRYENGLSASFEILRIQEDLAEARSREVAAVSSYRRAVVSLDRATGELLGKHSVKLVEPFDMQNAEYRDVAKASDADGLPSRSDDQERIGRVRRDTSDDE